MGSHTQATAANWAYIAGFLDGDGSLMVQVKRRKDTLSGWRFMFTICFYQDTRHEAPLYWIKKVLGIGYLSRRKDGITELKINGFEQVERIVQALQPYAKFKKQQVTAVLKLLKILRSCAYEDLPLESRVRVVRLIEKMRAANYAAHQQRYTMAQLRSFLLSGVDPVTTEVKRPR